jgi:polysaccharide biosynthesis/export protein
MSAQQSRRRLKRAELMIVGRLLVALIVVGALAGCGERAPSPAATAGLSPYHLDTGDELRVVVFEQASLTNLYRVDPSGHIAMPLIGAVPARGATTAELEARLAERLARNVLRQPDVTVEVATHRPFFVLGEVSNPGQYPFVPGMTAEMAVAAAGGFTPRANKRTVRVSRTIAGRRHEGRIAVTQPIRAGDTIYVPERLF